ncbi:hypothetical protein CDL15_Pgr005301 [Punica granatum]|uniref:AAA+ ATPase domain-containing protein n=1 Tax=Punica granatum TaxID=22663 RepID=A0A218XEJ7_PUNGR|nr:hypothetical protein CDL15_Pgr005301 [Punica granatum]
MADIANVGLTAGLSCWDRTANYRKYIQSLADNLNALESKMVELGHVYDDVNRLVSAAEGEQWIRKGDLAGWLERVDTHRKEAEKFLADGKQTMGKTFLCGLCFCNCRARYKQSKLAEAKRAGLETELALGRTFRVKDDVAYEPADLILKRNLEALHPKTDDLHSVFETVLQKVKEEEDNYRVRTHEVGCWLERVQLLEKEAQEILEQGAKEMESCQGIRQESLSQRNCTSYHELSKHAEEKRATLEEELRKGSGFTIFTYKRAEPLMVEIPLEPPTGLHSTFQEVWEWVQDAKVRCIGLYGMGGVGKTTLLKMIHNEFLKIKHDYNMAAWIVASHPPNLEEIQKAIFRKLHLPKSEWDDTSESDRAGKILSIMKEKKFLLFLDDIWDQIDLLELGIPSHNYQHKSKIIFTTRSLKICGLMQADRTKKVECLPPDEALQLFRGKVGKETWSAHAEIPKLAEDLVKECEYLPLALITIGASMASRRHLDDWKRALEDLESRPSEFEGIERVFSRLEFSYKALPNEVHKKCFLYCSIFPEDHKFQMEELIDLCIGEGFLNECDSIHDARHRGINIISSLRRACLLEEDSSGSTRRFRMHDVIRDMALWLASNRERKKKKILVQKKRRSFETKEFKMWNSAERISLWDVDQSIGDLPAKMSCSNLSTLILRNTEVTVFPNGFFPSMPSLRVLDLFESKFLVELPEDIGVLVNLRYLNLRWTRIKKLPLELKNLIKLVFLLVDRTCRIPKGMILSLSSLKVFHWGPPILSTGRTYEEMIRHLSSLTALLWGLPTVSTGRTDEGDERNVIGDLDSTSEIDEAHLSLYYAGTVKKLLMDCSHLQRCLGELRLVECKDSASLIIPKSSLRRMEHLNHLSIYRCEYAEISMCSREYGCSEAGRSDGSLLADDYIPGPTSSEKSQDCFRNLKKIDINGCRQLRDLSLLIYHSPSLANLTIEDCPAMQELIGRNIDDFHVDRIFSCLIELHLTDLPEFESIKLPFPSLELLEVKRCPKLKKLPLNTSSARGRSLAIVGEQKWWSGLQWDDPQTEKFFITHFNILQDPSEIIEQMMRQVKRELCNSLIDPGEAQTDFKRGREIWITQHSNLRRR